MQIVSANSGSCWQPEARSHTDLCRSTSFLRFGVFEFPVASTAKNAKLMVINVRVLGDGTPPQSVRFHNSYITQFAPFSRHSVPSPVIMYAQALGLHSSHHRSGFAVIPSRASPSALSWSGMMGIKKQFAFTCSILAFFLPLCALSPPLSLAQLKLGRNSPLYHGGVGSESLPPSPPECHLL